MSTTVTSSGRAVLRAVGAGSTRRRRDGATEVEVLAAWG
ncbi:hypothetical protein ABH931_003635 [Streptacidiphilus sp. MAP12-33]